VFALDIIDDFEVEERIHIMEGVNSIETGLMDQVEGFIGTVKVLPKSINVYLVSIEKAVYKDDSVHEIDEDLNLKTAIKKHIVIGTGDATNQFDEDDLKQAELPRICVPSSIVDFKVVSKELLEKCPVVYFKKETCIKKNVKERNNEYCFDGDSNIYIEMQMFDAIKNIYKRRCKDEQSLKEYNSLCQSIDYINIEKLTLKKAINKFDLKDKKIRISNEERIIEICKDEAKRIDVDRTYYHHEIERYGDYIIEVSVKNGCVNLSAHCYHRDKDGIIWCENRTCKRSYTPSHIFAFFRLFDQYYPDSASKLLTGTWAEREVLLDVFQTFVPEECAIQAREQIRKRVVEDKILGVVNDPALGMTNNLTEENDYNAILEGYSNPVFRKSIPTITNNQITNLLICLTQGFMTVISGSAGNAKGAVCDALGTQLGLCFTEDTVPDRYQVVEASKVWNTKEEFAKLYETTNAPLQPLFSVLNEEANGDRKRMPFSVVTIKNATKAPIDTYLEDFVTLCNKWNQEWYHEDVHFIGDADLKLPNTFRILLTSADEQEGILSSDLIGLMNVIEITDAVSIREAIKNIDLNVSYAEFEKKYKPTREQDPLSDKIKTLESVYQEIFEDVLSFIKKNVSCNGRKIEVRKLTIRNAVYRYWYIAKKYMQPEVRKAKDELVPEGIIWDDECYDNKKYLDQNGRRESKIVALDYVLSQRVLTYITKLRGDVEIKDVSELIEKLIENKLDLCAESLKNAIESGRVRVADELTETSNEKLIIKKCEDTYNKLLVECEELYTREDLITHICELVNLRRDKDVYTRNVIINMLICLTQGFVTVFSGKPGCGKTSICRILGETLGLTNFNDNNIEMVFDEYIQFVDRRNENVETSRYIEVSTERGWTSKRDFIGYYNPLTESFDKTNALLYNAFLVMDHEAKDKTKPRHLPYFILLDEANLSPMEYYWADFMNLCEAWRENNSIDLGGGRIFKIPETLHFIATINNDHTTEILSPRLIDRANVIDLPVGEYKKIEETTEDIIIPICWEELKDAFGCSECDAELFETENAAKDTYNEIKHYVQDKFGVSISPRTDIAVSRYWTVAKECFCEEKYFVKAKIDWEDELEDNQLKQLQGIIKNGNVSESADNANYELKEVSEEIQAMDYAIAQRVLPKLTDVSGADAFRSLLDLCKMLCDKELYKSAGIVADLILRGKSTDFYNYFR